MVTKSTLPSRNEVRVSLLSSNFSNELLNPYLNFIRITFKVHAENSYINILYISSRFNNILQPEIGICSCALRANDAIIAFVRNDYSDLIQTLMHSWPPICVNGPINIPFRFRKEIDLLTIKLQEIAWKSWPLRTK